MSLQPVIANRPMRPEQIQSRYTIGALYRGTFRQAAYGLDLEIMEDRGLVDSVFILRGLKHQMAAMDRYCRILSDQIKVITEAAAEAERIRIQAKRWYLPQTWESMTKVLSIYLGILLGLPILLVILFNLFG